MIRALTLVTILLTVTAAAQDDPVTKARRLLGEAETLRKDGKPEAAAMRLRRAAETGAEIADASTRRNVLTPIEKKLTKVDPLRKKEIAARSGASRGLIREAEHEIKRGWHTTAQRLLDAANRITPGSADEAIQQLAGGGPKALKSLHDRYFGEAAHPIGETGWTVSADALVAPPLQRRPVMIVSKPQLGSKCTIRAEVMLGEGPGKMALAFGVTDELQYHLLELRNDLGFSELRLYWWDGRSIHKLGNQLVTLTRKERANWLPIQIEVDGQSLRGTIGDEVEEVRGKTRVDTAGAFGIFVSGDSRNQDSVRARFVRVEEKK